MGWPQILTLAGTGYSGIGILNQMSETRTYNSMLQLTRLQATASGYNGSTRSTSLDMAYVYNTGIMTAG